MKKIFQYIIYFSIATLFGVLFLLTGCVKKGDYSHSGTGKPISQISTLPMPNTDGLWDIKDGSSIPLTAV